MLKDLVNCDKVSYFFEEAPTSYSINSAGGQAKEAPSPLIQDRTMNTFKQLNVQGRNDMSGGTNSTVFGLSNQMRKRPTPIQVHQDQILLEYNILGIDHDICENSASQIGLIAAGQSEIVYFQVKYKNSNSIHLERVENDVYGWRDVKSRCYWDDRYVNLVMRRLNPQ